MRNKTISLCPNSFELAQKMPNFSNWVRKQLLAKQKEEEYTIKASKQYRCPACFKIYREQPTDPQYCLSQECGYIKPMELFE